jgi:hypothetical protein
MRPVKRIVGIASLTLLLTMGGARLSRATTAETSVAERGYRSAVQVPPSRDGEQTLSYQEREARHSEAADFRGGDAGIYIGGSAGVLVVVLLIILILR